MFKTFPRAASVVGLSGVLVLANPSIVMADEVEWFEWPVKIAEEAWSWDVPTTDASYYEAAHCFLRDNCAETKDALAWALDVTESEYGTNKGNGDESDAFRHCLWAGALSNRLGQDEAKSILSNHEVIAYSQDKKHLEMDMSNNWTGAEIGAKSKKQGGEDEWGWVIEKCESKARSGELVRID